MIIEINGLKVPESIKSTSELTQRVSDKQVSAGGRYMIREPVEKWLSVFDMGDLGLDITFQKNFYDLCRAHYKTPATVVIVNPYDGGGIIQAQMICTKMPPPSLLQARRRVWSGVSATWEEV